MRNKTMDMKIANRLYDLRKASGLSQDELADKLQVTRQAVSKWERGESSPDTDNLIALAKLYGVSIDELLDYQPTAETTFERADDDKASKPNFVLSDDDGSSINVNYDGDKAKVTFKTEDGKEYTINAAHEAHRAWHMHQREDNNYTLKRAMRDIPVFFVCVIGYLLMGFLMDIWHPTWLIFPYPGMVLRT